MEKQLIRLDRAKLAGWFFQAGNFGLLALGSFNGSWSELAAGASWITAGEMLRRHCDDTRWFAGSCVASVAAMSLTNYKALSTVEPSELLTLSSPATATAIGTALFVVGYGVFGAFSKPLSQAFRDAKNSVVRWTLGRPRLATGVLGAVSMVPMIKDTIASQNIPLAAIITSFLVGEALIAASSPDKGLLTNKSNGAATPPGIA